MSVTIVKNKSTWQDNKEFIQSWTYGDFLTHVGRNILRLKIEKEGEISYIQLIKKKQRFGISFYYVPRGIFSHDSHVEELLEFAKKQNISFVRLEPSNHVTIPAKYRTIPTTHRQPAHSWLLDITPDTDILLQNMHSKTRYNIRLAKRKGVEIDEEKNIDVWWPLHMTTTKRKDYIPHPKKYIEELLTCEHVYQINARYNGEVIASAIVWKHDTTAYYYMGASANKHRNVMAPYLIHMHIIERMKELGCTLYDWWGMAPATKKGSHSTDAHFDVEHSMSKQAKSSNEECYHNYCWQKDHPFAGFARFKAGFSGYSISYPRPVEIPLQSFSYALFRLQNKARKQHIIGHPV